MHIHLLSCRKLVDIGSMGVATELEDLIVQLSDGTLLTPEKHPEHGRAIFPDGYELIGDRDKRALIIIALWTELASHVNTVSQWQLEFASVIVYIVDPWGSLSKWPNSVPKAFDCIFVPDERTAEIFRLRHRVKAKALPLGADVLTYGCGQTKRPLDVVAYGRQHEPTLALLKECYNNPKSTRIVYHTTAWKGIHYKDNRRLLWKLLQRSKISLCFDVFQAPHEGREYSYPVIPARYYEAVAAGTVVVGWHPQLPDMKKQFGWPEATLDLPANPDALLGWLNDLLDDQSRLDRIHQRNFAEALHRHDWRYRIRDLFAAMNWPLPRKLKADLQLLAAEALSP